MRLVLLGASLTSSNNGVTALTRGTIAWLRLHLKDPEISLVAFGSRNRTAHKLSHGDKDFFVEEHPACSLKKGLLALLLPNQTRSRAGCLSCISSADYVLDLSEGDSFSDIYGVERFIIHSFLKLVALRYKKKLVLMPQTLGPFENGFIAAVARVILNRAHRIFVRDELSLNYAVEKLHVHRDVELVPDMAFWMPAKTTAASEAEIQAVRGPLIGLNVSGLLLNGGYRRNNMFGLASDYGETVRAIVSLLLELEDSKILFLPHVTTKDGGLEDDAAAICSIVEGFSDFEKRRFIIVSADLEADEYKYLAGKCDFFIGSRMHACIAALSMGVPTVPLAYSRKFAGVWRVVGMQDMVVDLTISNGKNTLGQLSEYLGRIPAIAKTTEEAVGSIQSLYAPLEKLLVPSLQRTPFGGI